MKNILMLIVPLLVLTSCTGFEAKRAETKEYIKDGKCTLHNVELVNEVQKIAYGFPIISSKYMEYHYKYFPNYEPFIMGGCFYSESFPKEKSTKICPKCKEAYLSLKAKIEKE